MAQLLVVFATTHGQAAKIAHRVTEACRAYGHNATIANLASDSPDPAAFDGIVVTASVHAGSFQPQAAVWVRVHASVLNRNPTLFIPVCLGILQHDPQVDRDLQKIVSTFCQSTGWQPGQTHLVAGAIKYTQYGFLTRWVMKRIARRAGGGIDTTRDYEYTDWVDLQRVVESFAERMLAPASSGSHAMKVGA
jgi:menaquinone-dependent protoporphyrinogen oxidase